MKNGKKSIKRSKREVLVETVFSVLAFLIGAGIVVSVVGRETPFGTDGVTRAWGCIGLLLMPGSVLFLCRRIRSGLRTAIHGREGVSLYPMKAREFDRFYDGLAQAFVWEERRGREQARALLTHPAYAVYSIWENGETVGYVALWFFSEFVFLEHFFVFPHKRNGGYGGKALRVVEEAFGKLILEAELPETSETATRRVAFYKRNGFVPNARSYAQPSYHGEAPVPLMLMSYPVGITDFDDVVALLYEQVYGIRKE